MTRERSLEIVRQVIDLREQLYELSRETGLDIMMSGHPEFRDATVSLSGDSTNFFVFRRYLDNPEYISLIWHGNKGSEDFDNLTQVHLNLLEGEKE